MSKKKQKSSETRLHLVEKIYVVTMYRWGERENHSYVHSVHGKKQAAIDAAKEEEENRGGSKYYPEVLECTLGTGESKVIINIGDNL